MLQNCIYQCKVKCYSLKHFIQFEYVLVEILILFFFFTIYCLVLNASVTLSPKLLLNESILFTPRVSTIFSAKSLRINPENGWYFYSCTNSNLPFHAFGDVCL